MDISTLIIQTVGGLGVFILGMNMMTDGLKLSAGPRIKAILCAVSSNRFIGCAAGTFATSIIQSSSATTVMLIGFVSAGLITLQQAIGVILGANIGTTVTSQLIAFKLSSVAMPAIAAGVAMKFFAKQNKYRYFGEVVLGFGLLFFGMTIMKHALSPIKNDPAFLEFFTRFDPATLSGLLLCVATGCILTIMVQSSSATVGFTMTLASQGLLAFPAAMAIVLGENIGTTITAELATIGTKNVNAHRAARAHTIFNVFGVGFMLMVFPHFVTLVESITGLLGAGPLHAVADGELVNVSRYIANGHTIFNVLNALIFLCFLPILIKMAIFLSPESNNCQDPQRAPQFDGFFHNSPFAALAQVRSEVIRMSTSAMLTLKNTVECIEEKDPDKLNQWIEYEEHLDLMRNEITHYLVKVYQGNVNEEMANEISSLMRMTNNIEKIGDSVENLAKLIKLMIEDKLSFSEGSISDLMELTDEVMSYLQFVTEQIQNKSESLMDDAERIGERIDSMRESMRASHIRRLREGSCGVEGGLVIIDMLSNLEKIGDYCFNIAQAVTGSKGA